MLLDSNTTKVIKLIRCFDYLKQIDKIRLAINILENIGFNPNYNVDSIINLLKKVLERLDSNYNKVIVNFSKYKTLLFISTQYMTLSEVEKMKFTIEMLFNIYETDFTEKDVNKLINNNLNIYDYSYALNVI